MVFLAGCSAYDRVVFKLRFYCTTLVNDEWYFPYVSLRMDMDLDLILHSTAYDDFQHSLWRKTQPFVLSSLEM